MLKKVIHNTEMQKKFGDIFKRLEVDPISGEYYITLPESIVNELSWYEDSEIKITLDGDEIVLSERKN
jgi:hypothetical protein